MSDNTTQKAPDPDKGEVLDILQTLSELIEKARRWLNQDVDNPATEEVGTGVVFMVLGLVDALKAVTVPSENEREALAILIDPNPFRSAWADDAINQENRKRDAFSAADRILARFHLPVPVSGEEIVNATLERAAVAAEVWANENEEGGYALATHSVSSVIRALAVPVEPEWEYALQLPSGLIFTSDLLEDHVPGAIRVRRHKTGSWQPLDPESRVL